MQWRIAPRDCFGVVAILYGMTWRNCLTENQSELKESQAFESQNWQMLTSIWLLIAGEKEINWDWLTRMNNWLADEVITSRVVAKELARMDENQTRELSHLINQMATVLEIFSQPNPFKPRDEDTKTRLHKLTEILADLNEWREEIEKSNLDAKGKKSSFLPKSTWFAWQLILTNVPAICHWAFEKFPQNYICPSKFKNLQNILENHFSQVFTIVIM